MATQVSDITAIRLRPKTILVRIDPPETVNMGSSSVGVYALASGLVIPVDADASKKSFMHQTRVYVERCGPDVDTRFTKGVRVFLRDHPDVAELECGGVEYKIIHDGAVRLGMEVVEVAVG